MKIFEKYMPQEYCDLYRIICNQSFEIFMREKSEIEGFIVAE
jgi:hypothetical protein